MRKIPIVRSIGRAYGFGLGHFTTAVAICWLPYLIIVTVAVFIVIGPAHDLFAQFFSIVFEKFGQTGEAANGQEGFERVFKPMMQAYGNFYRYAILFFLLNTLLQAMMAIGLTRASMRLDIGNGFFYSAFDAPVWKLFGAWLATYLIMYAATAVIVFVGILLGIAVGAGLMQASIPVAIGFCMVLVIAALSLLAWIAIRLNFFLPAIIVSEKKLDLLRAWNLSEGNVWRIVAIYLSFLPVLLVLFVAGSLAKVFAFFTVAPHWLNLPERLTDQANWLTWNNVMADMLPWLPPLIAVALLAQILFQAMLYAATARAYRGVVATDIASQTERE